MWQFLSDLTRRASGAYSVVIFEENSATPSREYTVRPQAMRRMFIIAALVIFIGAAAITALTPLSEVLSGADVDRLRQTVRLHARRVAALQDSLAVQRQYARHVGALLTGYVDSLALTTAEETTSNASMVSGSVHLQPAFSLNRLPAGGNPLSGYSRGPAWPVLPPVEGFITRGFNAQAGHYAVDVAVEKGTEVRSIGAGYVVFADWTREGGYAIAVQHPGGYLSIYKHNSRLLQTVGDRVGSREPIALSGNTGHITTGPHVHVELWHNGLAQDPRQFIIGW